MGLYGKTCDVRIYGPRRDHHCCEHGCDDCRVGCFNPAAHRNPFYGKWFCGDGMVYWWRHGYSNSEYLCAKCYDEMVSDAKETEERYRGWGGAYREDPEYTAILETL